MYVYGDVFVHQRGYSNNVQYSRVHIVEIFIFCVTIAAQLLTKQANNFILHKLQSQIHKHNRVHVPLVISSQGCIYIQLISCSSFSLKYCRLFKLHRPILYS